MQENRPQALRKRSTMHLLGHPLHAMLVVFPLSLLILPLATDALYLWQGRDFWAEASFWLAVGGLAMGLAAAVFGMIDFFTMRAVRRHLVGWSHFLAGTMALALAGANVQLRWTDPQEAVWPLGIALSAVLAATVSVTGWLGGTLTFKYGIGSYGSAHDDDARNSANGDDEYNDDERNVE